MKRFYDSMFYFNCGAAIAVVVLARMFDVPQLASASLWFGLGAAAFYISSRALR